MPRYFFNVKDGTNRPDLDGVVLEDLTAARGEAVRFSAALLADHYEKFWDMGEWSMRVSDEDNLTLFQLTFFATESPASSR